MAQTTTAALQAALNTITGHDVGSPNPITILEEVHDSATSSRWLCSGNCSTVAAPAVILAERAKWCKTTVLGNDAAQAAEIVVAMLDNTTTVNGNIDPDAQV